MNNKVILMFLSLMLGGGNANAVGTDSTNILGHYDISGVRGAWRQGYAGRDKAIVILESFGFDVYHPGVAGRIVHEACFATKANIGHCEGGQIDPKTGKVSWIGSGSAMTSSCDVIGKSCEHGSGVMGVAAANYGDLKGIAPEADLILIRAQDRPAALKYVANHLINQFDIVAVSNSYSIGCISENPNDEMQKSIQTIVASGAAVIAGAGNSGKKYLPSPACRNQVISVGALSGSGYDQVASFSNNTVDLDLFAPGQELTSLKTNSTTSEFTGTSFSTPLVAGAWALLKSAKPNARVDESLAALTHTGKPVLDTRNLLYDAKAYHVGEVNAQKSFGKNSVIRLEKASQPSYHDGYKNYKACIIEHQKTFCFQSGINGVDVHSYDSVVQDIIGVGENDTECVITDKNHVCNTVFDIESEGDFSRTNLYECGINDGNLTCKAIFSDYRNILETASTIKNAKEIEVSGEAACAIHDNEVSCWGTGAEFGLNNVPTNLENPKSLRMAPSLACLIDQKTNGNQLHCWGSAAEGIDLTKFDNPSSFSMYAVNTFSNLRKAAVCAIQNQAINCQGNYITYAGFDLSKNFSIHKPHSVAINSHSICVLGASLECHYAKAIEQDVLMITNPKLQIDEAISVLLADSDGDGLGDADELSRGTNKDNSDSDGDGLGDAEELKKGTDPLVYNRKIFNPNYLTRGFYGNEVGVGFGSSVQQAGDINADGYPDMVVGISWDSTNGSEAGSVQVISGKDNLVLYKLYGENSGDWFGKGVAGSGDLNSDGHADFLVSAPNFNAPYPENYYFTGKYPHSGRVYAYSGFNGALLYTIDGTQNYGQLGKALDGIGDVNQDGYADFALGQSNFSKGQLNIYSGVDGLLLFEIKDNNIGDRIGFSVSRAGDVNNDGYPDIITGAPYSDLNGMDFGFAQVISGKNGSILYKFSGKKKYQRQGESVGGAGDVNKDGYADLIIGSRLDDNVTVYSGKTGDILYYFTGDKGDNFGASVAGAGDVNGDGYADFAIGAPQDDNMAKNSGSVRVISGKDGTDLAIFNGEEHFDNFGRIVSGGYDMDKDGFSDLVVGGGIYNNKKGSAYIILTNNK